MREELLVSYPVILSDMKKKRKELDEAIARMEYIFSGNVVQYGLAPMDYRLSVYDMAIELLIKNNRPMKTKEIVNAILNSGKKFSCHEPKVSIAATLYKSVKEKKDCQITKVGMALWDLKERR